MAAQLATCTKEEQRYVIRFLSTEGVKSIEIHRRIKVQYGDACLSLQQVYGWTGKFMNGISSETDSPRPGQAHPVVTPEGIAAVEAIVKENRRVTVNEISAYLGMSHGSAHHIVRDKKLKKYLRFSFDSPSYIKATRPVLEIFTTIGYFPGSPPTYIGLTFTHNINKTDYNVYIRSQIRPVNKVSCDRK